MCQALCSVHKPYLTVLHGHLQWWVEKLHPKEIKQMVQAASVRDRFGFFVLNVGPCVFAIIVNG